MISYTSAVEASGVPAVSGTICSISCSEREVSAGLPSTSTACLDFSSMSSLTNSQVTRAKTRKRPSIWKRLVGWPYQKMLRPTVKILRVVMTKGAKCCLNCLIMRQTNICPKVLSMPMSAMLKAKREWSSTKEKMSPISRSRAEYTMLTMATHLLIWVIISMGSGLQTDLISAWKSGRKPSARRETISSTMPISSVFFSSFLEEGSKALNMTMPMVMSTPITIFLVARVSFLSLTREQRTPTRMTEMRLQDLNIMTTGKLVMQMAQVQVRVEMETVMAQMAEFLLGMCVRSLSLMLKWLTIDPITQVTPQGKMRKPAGQLNFSIAPVLSFSNPSFSLSGRTATLTRAPLPSPSRSRKCPAHPRPAARSALGPHSWRSSLMLIRQYNWLPSTSNSPPYINMLKEALNLVETASGNAALLNLQYFIINSCWNMQTHTELWPRFGSTLGSCTAIKSLFLMKEGIFESAFKQTDIMDAFSNGKRKRKMEFYSYEPRQQGGGREESAKKTLIEVDDKEFSPLRPIELKNRINGWVEPFQLQDRKAATFRTRRLSRHRQEVGSADHSGALSPDRIQHLKTILKQLQTPQRAQAEPAEEEALGSPREEREVQIISLPPRRGEAPFHTSAAMRVGKKKVINYSTYKQNHPRRSLVESTCVEPELLRGALVIREAGRRRDLRG